MGKPLEPIRKKPCEVLDDVPNGAAAAAIPGAKAALKFLERTLAALTFLERGLAVHSDAGDFAGALGLCDFAVASGFGRHYEAKRESLEWAR